MTMSNIPTPTRPRKPQPDTEHNARKASADARDRKSGRGAVGRVLGVGVKYTPSPAEWDRRSAALGIWPMRLADLIRRISGRWWRWSGTKEELRRLIDERWPGAIGMKSFNDAFHTLAAEGMLASDGGMWEVNKQCFLEDAEPGDSQ